MEKFHITIKDNETGETFIDTNTSVIIGAFDEGKGTRHICLCASTPVNVAATIMGAKQSANDCEQILPVRIYEHLKELSKKSKN